MIALLQRVSRAKVEVEGNTIGAIDRGLLVLLGVQKQDSTAQADKMLQRLLAYRVFADESGKMNLSLTDVNGGLLLVPQFTLAADTSKGLRPSFSSAAPPEMGQQLFDYLLNAVEQQHTNVAAGQFAADMQVSLTNDGPVSFILET